MGKLWKPLNERIDLVVLLSCLLLTYGFWSYGIKNDKTDLQQLEVKNKEVASFLSTEVNEIFNYVDGVAGLYAASDEVSQDDLSNYMKSTTENELHEEILRINFVAKVPNAEIPSYEKIIRKAGWPSYQAEIVPDLDEQFLIIQTVEKNGAISLVSGLNMYSDKYMKKLTEDVTSRRERSIVSVPRIDNVPEYLESGYVFADAVEKDGELIGFVTALVSRESLDKQIIRQLGDNIGWRWFENGELISQVEKEFVNQINSVSEIEIFPGINWRIETYTQKNNSMLWNIVLGTGVVFSFLIYIVVYSLTNANARGIELAKQMTQDLQKYKLALDSASNHIVITDINGVVVYANKSVQNLTGYDLSEILGKTPRLWGGKMGKDFYENFWNEIKTHKKVFSGLFSNRRKNGEIYSAQATVSPIIKEDGELVGFVGVEEDVTNEIHGKKEREESLFKLKELNKILNDNQVEMVKLLNDERDLERQLALEKKGVEAKVEERTKQLADEEAKLTAAISALPRAFVIIDTKSNIVTQNGRLEGIFGKIEGHWSVSKIDSLLGEEFGFAEKVKQTIEEKMVNDIENALGNKFVQVFMAPVIGLNEELIGAVIIIKDTTEARVLERSKDEFFSIASHELRTPLTAIRGNSSMMLDYYKDVFKDPELKQMMEDVHEGSVRLIEIVNDFLDMSRLEMGKVEYKIEDVAMYLMVEKVTKDLAENAKLKGIELKITGDTNIMARADVGKVEQILFNLIGNSIKFTDKGSIKVDISSKDGMARTKIVDTGKGIPVANQGLLFHKFQQAGDSIMTREGAKGTGLGLYISRLMAEGMGGKLELVKSIEGKGSTFGLLLPLKEKSNG